MKTENPKLTCPECGKTFKGSQGLNTHQAWEHNPASRDKRLKAARRTGDERARRNRGGAAAFDGLAPAVKTKRPYKRRTLPDVPRPAVNYCPRCGCNLEAVSLSLGFTK